MPIKTTPFFGAQSQPSIWEQVLQQLGMRMANAINPTLRPQIPANPFTQPVQGNQNYFKSALGAQPKDISKLSPEKELRAQALFARLKVLQTKPSSKYKNDEIIRIKNEMDALTNSITAPSQNENPFAALVGLAPQSQSAYNITPPQPSTRPEPNTLGNIFKRMANPAFAPTQEQMNQYFPKPENEMIKYNLPNMIPLQDYANTVQEAKKMNMNAAILAAQNSQKLNEQSLDDQLKVYQSRSLAHQEWSEDLKTQGLPDVRKMLRLQPSVETLDVGAKKESDKQIADAWSKATEFKNMYEKSGKTDIVSLANWAYNQTLAQNLEKGMPLKLAMDAAEYAKTSKITQNKNEIDTLYKDLNYQLSSKNTESLINTREAQLKISYANLDETKKRGELAYQKYIEDKNSKGEKPDYKGYIASVNADRVSLLGRIAVARKDLATMNPKQGIYGFRTDNPDYIKTKKFIEDSLDIVNKMNQDIESKRKLLLKSNTKKKTIYYNKNARGSQVNSNGGTSVDINSITDKYFNK